MRQASQTLAAAQAAPPPVMGELQTDPRQTAVVQRHCRDQGSGFQLQGESGQLRGRRTLIVMVVVAVAAITDVLVVGACS